VNGLAGNVGSDVVGTFGTLHLNAGGSYTYTLNNAASNVQALAAGQQVSDVFSYTNSDNHGGTSSATLTITITGSNDAATITASVSEDTAVLEAGGAANAVAGDPSASGQLTVHDVDSGENHFQAPGSLAGVYGTYTFDTTTGAWTYTLNQSLADPLIAGQVVHDHLIVGSADGTASYDIDVTITGSNDAATITASLSAYTALFGSGGAANAVAGDPSASGQLTVHDVDSGENH